MGLLQGFWRVLGWFADSFFTKYSQRTAFFGEKTSPDSQRTASAGERTRGISLRTASAGEGTWELSLRLARFGVGTAEISLRTAGFGESSTALGERTASKIKGRSADFSRLKMLVGTGGPPGSLASQSRLKSALRWAGRRGGKMSSKRVARGGRRRRLAALEEPLTKLT